MSPERNRVGPGSALFAAAIIALGFVGLVYGGSSLLWADIPASLPGRRVGIHLASVILVVAGAGLMLPRFARAARTVLLAFLLLWLALVKLAGIARAPGSMVSWEAFAEIAVIAAGAWCLFSPREGSIRAARGLMIAALPLFGLSHFVYHDLTASLVPKWMHFPLGWTYFTGAASIAAAAAMLFRIWPRLAAHLEAAMLWIITLLVWVPRVAAAPGEQEGWSELAVSCAIAAGTWIVADTYRAVDRVATGRRSAALPRDSLP